MCLASCAPGILLCAPGPFAPAPVLPCALRAPRALHALRTLLLGGPSQPLDMQANLAEFGLDALRGGRGPPSAGLARVVRRVGCVALLEAGDARARRGDDAEGH